MDVPSGERKHDLVVRRRQRAAEPQSATGAVAKQLPAEQAVDVRVDLEDRAGYELRDRPVQDGSIFSALVGVAPAEDDVPADDGIDLRLREPSDELVRLGERGPDAVDPVIEVALEPEEVEPVAGFERAADGLGIQAAHGRSRLNILDIRAIIRVCPSITHILSTPPAWPGPGSRVWHPTTPPRLGGLLTLLADPVRLRVLYALDLVDELCVGDIALATDATEDAVGYALRMLRTAGLVQTRKDGRVVYYRLADSFPEPLLEHCLRELMHLSKLASR